VPVTTFCLARSSVTAGGYVATVVIYESTLDSLKRMKKTSARSMLAMSASALINSMTGSIATSSRPSRW